MGGAQMGTIFDADVRDLSADMLTEQDVRDMKAYPDSTGALITEALQYGNLRLGFTAVGVLVGASVEPVPFEVRQGILVADPEVERLRARQRRIVENVLPGFGGCVEVVKEDQVATPLLPDTTDAVVPKPE
jgi:hypothetical protein